MGSHKEWLLYKQVVNGIVVKCNRYEMSIKRKVVIFDDFVLLLLCLHASFECMCPL